MRHIFVLILTSIFFMACGSKDQSECVQQLEKNIHTLDQQEDQRAKELDPEQSAIRAGNQSVVLKGNPDHIVFLLHGFIASPNEVRPLGEALNAQGYTVVMPLIAGFGRSTNAANATTEKEWVDMTAAQLAVSTACEGKIQVAGFSLGALLTSQALIEHKNLQEKVASLTLLSPALKIKQSTMMDFGQSILNHVNPTPRISFIASLARKAGNYDMDIPEAYPDYYNVELPIAASNRLKSLAAAVDYSGFKSFPFPVKIIYSENDHTIDGPGAVDALTPYRSDLSVYAIPASENIPHQIAFNPNKNSLNTVANEVKANFR